MNYTSENIGIAVIGGGNIGTQFACVCASKGYKVNVLSSKPELYDGTLEIIDEYDKIVVGVLNKVTSDISEAVNGCQIIFITYPAFRFKEIAEKLFPYVSKNMNICVLPGTGGAEFAFKECILAGATLFGLQRVPTVARLEQYAKRVRCVGLRKELFLASIPGGKADEMCCFFSDLWQIPCYSLPNYLSVTLIPSNQILHTTRLCTLFNDYKEGMIYKRNPLFYGEWDNTSSELLLACDEELQMMIKLIDRLDLSSVRSLKLHYECETADAITKKIRSINSLRNLQSPMRMIDGGWIPDFNSRFFAADFPYGLAIIEELSTILGYDAQNIKYTMDWYRSVTRNTEQFVFNAHGILCLQDLYDFY